MVLKRLFRRNHQQQDEHNEGSKASSRGTLDSSYDSLVQFLPEHVGETSSDYFERDDISSIHYGESVGSPPTTAKHRERYLKQQQHLKLLRSLRSTEELNYLVPSTCFWSLDDFQ